METDPQRRQPGDRNSNVARTIRQSVAHSLTEGGSQLSTGSVSFAAVSANTDTLMPHHESPHTKTTARPTLSRDVDSTTNVCHKRIRLTPSPSTSGLVQPPPHTVGNTYEKDTLDGIRENSVIGDLRFNDLPFSLKQSIGEARRLAVSVLRLYSRALVDVETNTDLVSESYLSDLIEKSVEEFSKAAMEKRAVEDSRDFRLSPSIAEGNERDLRNAGSIEELVRQRQILAAENRYNLQRCNAVLSDCDPTDLQRCRDLAVNGSHVPLPEGFIRQKEPNEMRTLARKLGNTYGSQLPSYTPTTE